ncbi:autotransporter-associated N-terminal domain-containing protein, partial [uncultured Leptotrichia sp.]|uniref:autotransporter-associated N-terminal domain-containing protein n=1 Tax=uncultured Leptotrichia sp. TaxID=159271 RepID=UPI0025FC8F36
GLLTIAPKLHADVASEQQEITAQTYDAITDLRQSFMRARKENEKSLKGAQSELSQLLKQGDQVIKSPWGSFQFGTGYMNNDWGTTYRGRGGKFLEYFRRNNDLTKYVFDKDKHLYGATNLNIPRNQEPDALTINPANMHEPYKPYVPERMNNVGMIVGPTFNPDFKAPKSVKTYYNPQTVTGITRSVNTSISDSVNYVGASMNNYNTTYTNDGSSNTDDTNGTVEITTSGSNVYNNAFWWNSGKWNPGTVTSISGGKFSIGSSSSSSYHPYSSYYYYYGGYSTYENIAINGSGTYWGFDDNQFSHSGTSYTISNDQTGAISYAALKYAETHNVSFDVAYNIIYPEDSNHVRHIDTHYLYTRILGTSPSYTAWIFNPNGTSSQGGTAVSGGEIDIFNNSPTTSYNISNNFNHHPVDVSVLMDKTGGTLDITRTQFDVNTSGYGNPLKKHSAIAIKNGTVNLGNSTDTGIGNGMVTNSPGESVNNSGVFINVQGNDHNNGIYLTGGTLNSNNSSYFVNGGGLGNSNEHHSNGILKSGGTLNSRRDLFTLSDGDDSFINGIFNSGGGSTVKGSKFNINGYRENNGILITGGTLDVENDNVSTNVVSSVFNVGSDNADKNQKYLNGIQLKGGTATIDADFYIKGNLNNGVINNNSGATAEIKNSYFDVAGFNNNGFYMKDGNATSYVSDTIFSITGANSNGVFVNDDKTLDKIENSDFTVGDSAIGLLIGHSSGTTGAKVNTISGSTFNVDATNGNTDSNGTGIYLKNGSIGSMKSTTITGNGNDVLITIDRNSSVDNSITMSGSGGTNGLVKLNATGSGNTAINIQNGNIAYTKNVSVTGIWNSDLGDSNTDTKNNVVVRNNYYVDKLTVTNTGASPMTSSTNPNDAGMVRVQGDNGIVFSNLGHVKDKTSSVRFDAISMSGKNSAGAVFLNQVNDRTKASTTWSNRINTSVVNSGVFNGTLKIQGVIGANNGNDSSNSVGVYANTGQSKNLNQNVLGGPNEAMKNLTVETNIGFNERANDSVLIWSQDGTAIDVDNTTYTTNDFKPATPPATGLTAVSGLNDKVITDGVKYANSKVTWGYLIDNTKVSKGSVIGYATGYFDGSLLGAYNWATHNDSSKIDFQKEINMVSNEGTTLLATNSGNITAKDIRAGGYNTILAYASGNPAINSGRRASSITINGNVIAADNNTLGYYYNPSDTTSLRKTYSNIGAYAVDGGEVNINGTAVAIEQIEDKTQTSSNATASGGAGLGAPDFSTSKDHSLIYGMGAYASDGGKANVKKVAVITGENGALYADNEGGINFEGDIINQNNAHATAKIDATNGVTAIGSSSKATVRRARNLTGIDNDHENTTPFYVRRGRYSGTTWINDEENDKASITFTGATNIDMYDGILLTGNDYNAVNNYNAVTPGSSYKLLRDYESGTSGNAKYRGISNVKVKIMEDKHVNLGVINQPDGQLVWNTQGNTNAATSVTGTTNYLDSIGKNYAGGMSIQNAAFTTNPTTTPGGTSVGNRFDSTLINGNLKLTGNVTANIEDVVSTGAHGANNGINDPFNDIIMESTKVTIENGSKVEGNASERLLTTAKGTDNRQVKNAGLSMANSLYRWDSLTADTSGKSIWRKTKKEESGFTNNGEVNIYGGSENNNLAALNVVYGTVENIGAGSIKKAEIKLDHGYGIFATDGSIVKASGIATDDSTITVTGKYQTPSSNPPTIKTRSSETAPTGSNYGIVGISKGRVNYNLNDENSIDITSTNTTIKVDGGVSLKGAATATGIFAKNDSADKDKVTVKYDDSKLTSAGIELQNAGSSASSRGVGIALVNRYANGNGGEITLTGRAGTLGSSTAADNNIFTKESGIGIYAENSDIKLTSDNFTIITKDDGVGIWTTDASNVGKGSALHSKTFNYNYDGKTDKKGFAMAFTGRAGQTDATNYLDIKFNNKGTTTTKLADEIAKSTGQGTYKGIAGIVVNTNDALDTVTNYGDIKEEKSKTHVRTYGAVVNKGTFRNFGDITLNESLSAQAKDVTSEDMKKANIGIFANDLNDKEGGKNTYIENYADIKIGDMTAGNSDKNIGSWAIYGYNIKTGKKSDGTQQTIDIARNNYGIYSGDGTVDIRGTKINVGNDTVLGHKMNTWTDSNGTVHNIDRQNGQYSQAQDLLSKLDNPRERDSAIGVYIDSNESRSGDNRNVRIDADMDIDRFSNGIVIAENNSLKNPITTVTIGDSNTSPNILLGSNKVTGGPVLSTKPTNPRVPDEIYEQGNSVYYYSADKNSNATSWANVKMNGDYNTAYYTEGSVENHGNIDLRSQNNLNLPSSNAASAYHGYGNVGIASANVDAPSVNYGTITTGMSDTENLQYSIGMGAGRNIYVDKTTATGKERVYDRTEKQGHVVNKGKIVVQEDDGIGMFATGSRSRAENWGTIELVGNNAIGMYLDRGAIGENHGTITGNANNLKGVLAINGGYIKNYGTIKVEGSGSNGIVTDDIKVKADNEDGSSSALYNGTENSIKLATTGNPKTTGVGTTITMPSIVPITKISVDGVDTPIFNVETDAANIGDIANNITVKSSIQTGGTRIIDLKAIDEWGNPVWPQRDKPQLSEVTSVGMYVDTSGVRYTNPVDGLQNLPKLGEVNLYFGPEATLYTNAKAIRIGDTVDANGTVTKSNMLKPFNDALAKLPGGAIVNPLSASLTWQVAAKLDANNQLSEIYMSKVPYHSFAYDNDKSLVNFTNNLDNIYEIARPQSAEKIIFNKLNSLGNGEGHILAQAFDQMRGHIYGGVQQRIKSTSDILGGEINSLRSERNVSKDSNKFKAFGQRNEFKTDTAGMPDWYSNAGGFAFVHEDETVRLGQSSGWSAGVVNNYFTFKDLSKSYENQA